MALRTHCQRILQMGQRMLDFAIPDTAQFGKVAVVMGGWSAEREVSLMSGQQVHEALLSAQVDAHIVDAKPDVVNVLVEAGFDRAFLILHGRGGEDGHVQGALELAGMPYTGSDLLGCALAMDKHRSKTLCMANGVPTADYAIVNSAEEALSSARSIGYPVVIKPTQEGSSIGVSMVNTEDQTVAAYEKARQYGQVMIERRLMGLEVTAAILGDRCLPLVSMKAAGEFYDYNAKYVAEDTVYTCPAELSNELVEVIQAHALNAFSSLGCSGWGRVDFMLDEQQQPYFIECNTAPGMTSHSLVPMAAKANGIGFAELCLQILKHSLTCEVPA